MEERNKMLALLRKFEDENGEEQDELEEDQDDLAKKLEAIDLGIFLSCSRCSALTFHE